MIKKTFYFQGNIYALVEMRVKSHWEVENLQTFWPTASKVAFMPSKAKLNFIKEYIHTLNELFVRGLLFWNEFKADQRIDCFIQDSLTSPEKKQLWKQVLKMGFQPLFDIKGEYNISGSIRRHELPTSKISIRKSR